MASVHTNTRQCWLSAPACKKSLHRRKLSRCSAGPEEQQQTQPAASTCSTCGVALENKPFGCDGTGRVVGGVGAVLPWWPVKAYRPCPKLAEAGLTYSRKGQALNDVLFPTPRQQQK